LVNNVVKHTYECFKGFADMNGFIVVQINDYKGQYLHLPGKMIG